MTSPLADRIDALQDAGRNIYIAGHQPPFALVVDVDNGQCSVAHVDTQSGLGRWECTIGHRRQFADLYAKNFPHREGETP